MRPASRRCVLRADGEAFCHARKKISGSYGIMHNKFVLIDQKVLFTGSIHWTAAAENTNYENLVRLNDSDLLRACGEQFETLWSRAQSPR